MGIGARKKRTVAEQLDEIELDDLDLESAPPAAPGPPGLTQMIIVLTLLPGLLIGLVLVGDNISNSDRYLVDLNSVSWNAPPSSPASGLARDSMRTHRLDELRRSIFDPDLGYIVSQNFEANPWVRRVKSARRVFPRGLEIELDYRIPYAAVERDGVYLIADRDGDLLPIESRRPILPPPVISVRDVFGDAINPKDFSESWFLDAVREGVAVLHDLEDHHRHPVFDDIGIDRIDVSNFRNRLSADKSETVLVTNRRWSDERLGVFDRPVLVDWGRSTRHRFAKAELDVPLKLKNLLGMVQLRSDLHGVGHIDVRFPTPFWRPYVRPIARNDGP